MESMLPSGRFDLNWARQAGPRKLLYTHWMHGNVVQHAADGKCYRVKPRGEGSIIHTALDSTPKCNANLRSFVVIIYALPFRLLCTPRNPLRDITKFCTGTYRNLIPINWEREHEALFNQTVILNRQTIHFSVSEQRGLSNPRYEGDSIQGL